MQEVPIVKTIRKQRCPKDPQKIGRGTTAFGTTRPSCLPLTCMLENL